MAAIIGDTVGYWIGAKAGPKIFTREKSLLFSRKHLLRTKEFYERHGGKTIIIARFMPIIRTFAPVVAGVGKMSYRRFVSFNVFGGIGWVLSMTLLGFTLGKIYPPITKQIDKVIIVIIVVSLMPGAISYLSTARRSSPHAADARHVTMVEGESEAAAAREAARRSRRSPFPRRPSRRRTPSSRRACPRRSASASRCCARS